MKSVPVTKVLSGLQFPNRLRNPVVDDEGTGMKINWVIFHMVEPSLLPYYAGQVCDTGVQWTWNWKGMR